MKILKDKKNIIIILLGVILALNIGFIVYTYIQMPKTIEAYVKNHKEELRGERGEKGDKGNTGANGIDGVDGANGADGYSGGLNCSSYNIGDRTYTNCY